MALLKIPKKELEKHFKMNDELISKISMMGIPVEQVTDEDVEVEVMPNRADVLSVQGFLRALKAFTGKEKGLKKYSVSPSGEKLTIQKSLPKDWIYAYACIVKGISFNNENIKEIIQIQEKLGTTLLRNRKKGGIGLYPLDKINFPITFKGMRPEEIKFRPLEYPEIITGRQILSKHPTGREYAHLVENWEVFPVFMDKKGIIMSMPPIINSHDVGKIDEKTKNVFLECTGTDAFAIKKALIILLATLAEMGGKIYSIECTQQNGKKDAFPDMAPEKMKISLDNTNKLLGLKLKERDLEKLLPRMGYDYKNGKVSVPPWRVDILHEVDVIEDIAIAYGYENLVPEMPKISTIGEESVENKLKTKISEILIGLGMLEISTYYLITSEEARFIPENERIELENAKTEYKTLRYDLISPAIRILSQNKDNRYPQKLFEMGVVFKKDKKQETGIAESLHLSIVLTPSNFTEAKQVLNYLFSSLSVPFSIKETSKKGCIEGRTAAIFINNQEIGYFGEIHPETLCAKNLKMPCSVLEISLDFLLDEKD